MKNCFGVFLIVFSGVSVHAQSPRFELLDAGKTGINFENIVVDNKEVNPFIYDNVYHGSGVAIADINNDGLQDIYFGGNQVADQLYLNKGNLVFEEIANAAGIENKGSWTTGVTMVDINGDGWIDIYVCKSLYDEPSARRRNELYINNGDLTFTESAREYGLDDTWRSQQAVFFDYDKDGDLDLFLVNQPPNPGFLSVLKGKDWRYPALGCRLLQNDNGKFIDVTKKANVFDRGYGLSATTGDFNSDGWPDLYVSNDYNNPDFLYINQRDGTFINTIDESMGHISYFSMGIDVADINNDNLPDILTVDMVPEDNYNLKANMGGMYPAAFWATVEDGGHYQYMLNTLQLNRGTNSNQRNVFSDVSQYAGMAYTDWSWSPLIADFDNDGQKDVFISNGLVRDLRHTDALENTTRYLKEKKSDIQEIRESNGKIDVWDRLSLDELLSFYPVRKISNYAFRNTGNLGFDKITETWGLDEPSFSTGAAYADLDNDGDLDLVLNNVNDRAFLYENKSDKNNSLRVILSPRGGEVLMGSKVEIVVDGEIQNYEFSNSRGFYSSSEPVAHFGIGKSTRVDQVKVHWSNGLVTKLTDVKAGSVVVESNSSKNVREGTSSVQPYFNEVDLLSFAHRENKFDDYEREILLPHQMSIEGPKVAVGDVDGDSEDEIYIPGAFSYEGTVAGSINANLEAGKNSEEVASLFFDADNDGDKDLYVVTGGNEFDPGDVAYQDLFYENKDGSFDLINVLPQNAFSGSVAINADFDSDGDEDLFVAGRQIPGQYPSAASSFIYRNLKSESGSCTFEDVTNLIAPELKSIGMVTSALWSDFDLDDDADLLVVGEWMGIIIFENINGKLNRRDSKLTEELGWWNHINAVDLDNDGDDDYVVGNLGLNYKFQATKSEPFIVYYDDFDGNSKKDIVLAYYNFGGLYPVRGRSCSAQQIPDIKKKFENYNAFASADIFQVYGEEALDQSLTLQATNFENSYIENLGQGNFRLAPLPVITQLSPINASVFYDLNNDGLVDIVYAGNKYGTEVETPRADAGIGGVLINNGEMNFEPVTASKSGLFLNSNVKDLKIIKRNQKDYLLVASNNDKVRLFEINSDNRN